MDFEKNGQSDTNFMHKIKKQAKRLFQLSKNNNNLEIKNFELSELITELKSSSQIWLLNKAQELEKQIK